MEIADLVTCLYLLSLFSTESRTRAYLFHFLKCLSPFLALVVYILSLAPTIVRPFLPSFSLAPRRAYRTTAADSLLQDLDLTDTPRSSEVFYRNCIFIFPPLLIGITWNRKRKKLGTVPFLAKEKWQRMEAHVRNVNNSINTEGNTSSIVNKNN